MEDDNGKFDKLFLLAKEKADAGDFDGAKADLDKLIILAGKDTLAPAYMVRSLMKFKLDRKDEAKTDWNEAKSLDPNYANKDTAQDLVSKRFEDADRNAGKDVDSKTDNSAFWLGVTAAAIAFFLTR